MTWFLSTRIGRALAGLLTALGLFGAIIIAARKDAADDALQDAYERDTDNAQAIRDRVERRNPERLREFSGRGFRDGE